MKDYPLNKVPVINDLKEFSINCLLNHKERIAFRYKKSNTEIEKTYEQFCNDIKFLGTFFLKMDIRNSNIAVIGENSYEWIVTYFAAATSSNIIVPIDKELSNKDIIGLLKEADCRVAVFSGKLEKTINEAKEFFGNQLILINMDKADEDNKVLSFSKLLSNGEELVAQGNSDFEKIVVDMNQVAAIHYTSGTTGVSKGVMLTHKNITSNACSSNENVKVYTTSVAVLPLNHTYGIAASILAMLNVGTTICINNSMKRISSDFKYYKPEHLFLVPLYIEVLYKRIWQTAKTKNKDKSLRRITKVSDFLLKIGIDVRKYLFKDIIEGFGGELKLIVCGGAPLDPKYVSGFRSFGINVLNGYGITECSPIVAVNRNEYYCDGSVGRILSCNEVKIINEDENGEGEILVKGTNVMAGYYKNEVETNKVIIDGWFNTGDIGKIDKDGFLFITGRKKNLIILSNGKNIYPEELEMLLLTIPYVNEALVYSVKGEKDKELSITAEVFLDTEYTNSTDRKQGGRGY